MKAKLSVGQKVWILKSKQFSNNFIPEIFEATVEKVGRLYFEVDKYHCPKFSLETMRKKCGEWSQYDYRVYLSEQEIRDEELKKELTKKLEGYLYGKLINLDSLKSIISIIESQKEKE